MREECPKRIAAEDGFYFRRIFDSFGGCPMRWDPRVHHGKSERRIPVDQRLAPQPGQQIVAIWRIQHIVKRILAAR